MTVNQFSKRNIFWLPSEKHMYKTNWKPNVILLLMQFFFCSHYFLLTASFLGLLNALQNAPHTAAVTWQLCYLI